MLSKLGLWLYVPGSGKELLAAPFNIMVSFRQLRDVLWEVKAKSKEAGSKPVADRRHGAGREQAEGWPLPCLPGTGGQQSLLVLLSPQRWGCSPPSFGGRRLVTQTKENTLLEGTNIGSFFLKPSRILPWESWTKAALSTERTAREPFSMMTDKHEET